MKVQCCDFVRSTLVRVAQKFKMKNLLKKIQDDQVDIEAKLGRIRISELWIPIEFETQVWYVYLDGNRILIQPENRNYHLEVKL